MGARLPHRVLDAGTCFWPLAWSKLPRRRRSEMQRLQVGVWRARRPAAHAAHVFVLNSRVRPPPAPRPPQQCTLSGLSSPLARDRGPLSLGGPAAASAEWRFAGRGGCAVTWRSAPRSAFVAQVSHSVSAAAVQHVRSF